MKQSYARQQIPYGEEPHRKSAEYQHIYCEIRYKDEALRAFTNDEALHVNYANEDAIRELKEELFAEYWRLAKEHLSKRQFGIMRMTADGYSQIEISKILNINQSSVTKCINGNRIYDGDKNPTKFYGGVKNKLRSAVKRDEKIQSIIRAIYDLME